MSAQVHALPRNIAGARPPMVPAGVYLQTIEASLTYHNDMALSMRWAKMTLEMRGADSSLHQMSMFQNPSGTLPNDDEELAILSGYSIQRLDDFLAVKAKLMQDWVLCSDGRWHHPLRAKNVLECWIRRREAHRKAALGNGSKGSRLRRGVVDIEEDIQVAASALRDLDGSDKFLDDLDVRMQRWGTSGRAALGLVEVTEPVTTDSEDVGDAVTSDPPPHLGTPKTRQAKRSQSLSSERSSEESCLDQREGEEIVEGEILLPLAGIAPPGRAPPTSWPLDWFTRFKALYPKKKSWGAAEKALERVRKTGKVPFATILAGVEQLVAEGKDPKYIQHAATWVNARGWEDEPDPPSGSGGGRSSDRPRSGLQSAAYGMIVATTPRSRSS